MNDKISTISITELHLFRDNPFKVRKDDAFDELVESISQDGIYDPLIICPDKENGGYVIISGQRRYEAAKAAGLEKVPAVINELDKDELIIAVVDNNICSRNTLPSEKAHAYKMKLEAMKHQGKSYGQSVHKLSRDEVSDSESGRNVQRYVRLTYLIPELLKLVDENRIAFSPAVALSYLNEEEQHILAETIELNESTPTYSQATKMKELSAQGMLTEDTIYDISSELKGNQIEKIRIPFENMPIKKMERYVGRDRKYKTLEAFMIKAAEFYCYYLDKQRNKDAR